MKTFIYYERLKVLWESMGFKDANEFAKTMGWKRAENILRLNRKTKSGNDPEPGMTVLQEIAQKHENFDFHFFFTGVKKAEKEAVEINQANEDSRKYIIKQIDCLECISKQKEIDALNRALEAKDELLDIYRNKKNEGKCG